QKARKKKPPNLPTVKVDVVTATVIEIPFLNEVMGTVQPVNRAAIAAKITVGRFGGFFLRAFCSFWQPEIVKKTISNIIKIFCERIS
ncbi:MAG: hypothetical protein JRC87_08220, partial [Deltaproteobacteria bacterium]|nr:hypothetical protein [Deltaproteobacteria bacterium]